MNILDYTAVELAAKIKAGEVTAVQAMQAVLDRIDEVEETYHCYVTLDKEAALKKAQEVQAKIEAGELTGPLAGVPVAIKDNMCTKDVLTTCSSKILNNFVPTFSSQAVLDLEAAGAVMIGKYGRICHGLYYRDFLLWTDQESGEPGTCTGRFFRWFSSCCGSKGMFYGTGF